MGTRNGSELCGNILQRRRDTLFLTLLVVLLCFSQFPDEVGAATGEEDGSRNGRNLAENNNTKVSHSPAPVPQVRYRNRPVASFRSNTSTKPTNANSTTNSNESNLPESTGVPSFAVHDLTSQTFEKLHENWRNLETFLRNLQVRRSQEESQRSSKNGGVSSSVGGRSGGDSRDNNFQGFPPFGNNNVYTLRYHPILEGQGASNSDNFGKGPQTRTLGGLNSFNPYPYDVRGEGSKDTDMERHTIATIYTIGICLTIMAIGSVMFILINKCDGSGGNSYVRSGNQVAGSHVGSRITRSMMGAVANSRVAGRQGRTRRGGGRSGGSASNNNNIIESASGGGIVLSENDIKILTDLPPSYDSLFPEGGPSCLKDVVVLPEASTSTRDVAETNVNLSCSTDNQANIASSSTNVEISNIQNENATPSHNHPIQEP